jgi:hypothetical protein
MGLLEPGVDALRAAMIPAEARRVRQFGEADRRSRPADDADPVIFEKAILCVFDAVDGRSGSPRGQSRD